MKISQDTQQLIAEINNDAKALQDKYDALSTLLKRDTDKVLSCCNTVAPNWGIHLFIEDGRDIEALKLIKDSCNVRIKWEDTEQRCYTFKQDNINFIVIVDKENMHDKDVL